MSTTTVLQPSGPTYTLSVGAASHAALTIMPSSNTMSNVASFMNTGTTTVALNVSAVGKTIAATLPGDGASAPVIVLPAAMQRPIQYVVPVGPFDVTAIGSGAGPSLVYIQPLTAV
jgi:hypothetical protein